MTGPSWKQIIVVAVLLAVSFAAGYRFAMWRVERAFNEAMRESIDALDDAFSELPELPDMPDLPDPDSFDATGLDV